METVDSVATHNNLSLIIERVKPEFTDNYSKIVQKLTELFQIKSTGILTIRITKASNAIIQCTNEETYKALLNKDATPINNNGRISALKTSDANNCVLFKGINAKKFESISQSYLDSWGIVDFKSLGSEATNVTKATCKDSLHADKLVQLKGVIVDYKQISIVKFEPRKTNVIICFNCAEFGHISAACTNKVRCYKCSSTEHSGPNCPSKNIQSAIKCPSCQGNHPQTFPRCPTYIAINAASASSSNPTNSYHRTYSDMARTTSPAIDSAKIENLMEEKFSYLIKNIDSKFTEIKNVIQKVDEIDKRSKQNEADILKANEKADTALSIIQKLVQNTTNSEWVEKAIQHKAPFMNQAAFQYSHPFQSQQSSSTNVTATTQQQQQDHNQMQMQYNSSPSMSPSTQTASPFSLNQLNQVYSAHAYHQDFQKLDTIIQPTQQQFIHNVNHV